MKQIVRDKYSSLLCHSVNDEKSKSFKSLNQNSSSNEIPSTSRGIVISSDEELRPTAADDVEIVGVVKPRHLRTPVIVSLSSDEEDVKKVIKTEEQVSDAF
jgi:hypothetical protein